MSLDADREASAFLADLEGILGLTYARKGRSSGVFDVLLLLGRPASGKSEFIDFLSRCPAERRAERFHVGDLRVVDDFPLLWEKFLEDDAWEKLGLPRLYSRRVGSNYVVTNPAVWPFLIDRIAHLVEEPVSRGAGPSRRTTVVEFSRGGPHAYFEALSLLSPGLLRRAAILYVSVSAEESSRRNAARYDPSRGGEVLTHSVPQEEMARTYAEDDWPRLAPAPWGWVAVRGVRVPYVAMHNEPELQDPNLLDRRYNEALDRLQALSHP